MNPRSVTGRMDIPLLMITVILSVTGLIIMYSASFVVALVYYDDPQHFLVRQVMWAALGGILMVAAIRTDYRRLRPLAVPILLLAVLALIAVLLIGTEVNGARRWLAAGPYTIQPSEFAKLAVIIYFAAWFGSKGQHLKSFEHGLVPFIVVVGSVGFLIMQQPNLGTTLVILLIAGTMFWSAGASVRQSLTLGTIGLAAVALLATTATYRSDRLFAFLHPQQDPQGQGFQTLQSLIAIGNGGVTGLGLGASRSKFFYIPESHTDGVFVILAEEAGFVAAAAVILLFVLFLLRGFRVSRRAPDEFGRLLAVGITTWITVQALLNIGGIMRVVPLTGVPLPFLSYGGNALAAELLAVGILISISRQTYRRPARTRADAGRGRPTAAKVRRDAK